MARPSVIHELDDDKWNIQTEWFEKLGDMKPGGDGAFSAKESADQITIEVKYRKLRSALQQIFGYSLGTGSPGFTLTRPFVPVQHPSIPWLWADALSSLPYNPLGVSIGGELKAKRASLGVPGGNQPPFESRYMRVNLGIRFKTFHGLIAKDNYQTLQGSQGSQGSAFGPSLPGGYQTFLGPISVIPKNEVISASGGVEGSSLFFCDTSVASGSETSPPIYADGPAVGPTEDAQIKGSVYTTKQVTEITLLWKQVEESYLVDTSKEYYWLMPIPARLMAHLGTVNKTDWAGKPAGTLLFDGIGLERYQQPVRTDTQFGLWAYDVTLKFKHFDPRRPPNILQNLSPGVSVPTPIGSILVPLGPSTPASPLRGWHCFPWRNNGFWYGATKGSDTYKGSYKGETQLRQTEFADMFVAVDNPTPPIPL